jgi:hypothetical protein
MPRKPKTAIEQLRQYAYSDIVSDLRKQQKLLHKELRKAVRENDRRGVASLSGTLVKHQALLIKAGIQNNDVIGKETMGIVLAAAIEIIGRHLKQYPNCEDVQSEIGKEINAVLVATENPINEKKRLLHAADVRSENSNGHQMFKNVDGKSDD